MLIKLDAEPDFIPTAEAITLAIPLVLLPKSELTMPPPLSIKPCVAEPPPSNVPSEPKISLLLS